RAGSAAYAGIPGGGCRDRGDARAARPARGHAGDRLVAARDAGARPHPERPMNQTRILIADDHEVVRKGLRSLLESEPGLEVVGEASNGREAVDRAVSAKPDVVVLDIGMPELNGLEATRRIVKAAPRTEVLILTVYESEEVIREVLRAGARGYVLKSDAGRLLLTALEAVSAHKPFFTSRVSELVLAGFLSGDQVRP